MAPAAPDFSIIVPTYQRPLQLARCLEALAALERSRLRFEVIVVDDDGTEPLDDLIARYRDRLDLTLVRLPSNCGPSAARNAGARRARGDHLAFTDDDCEPEPGWLEALHEAHRERPTCLVGGRTVNHLARNPCSFTSQLIVDRVYAHYNRDPEDARFFASNNLSLPRELFRRLGGFAEQLRTAEDRELCDRWHRAGFKLASAPEAVVRHAHELNVRSFFWQHFAYGRGALHFHRRRAARGSGRFWADLSFHLGFLKPLGESVSSLDRGRVFAVAALLVVWQLANAAGFLVEWVRVAIPIAPASR